MKSCAGWGEVRESYEIIAGLSQDFDRACVEMGVAEFGLP